MRRPPPSVVLVARTHWLVGAAIVTAIVIVHAITRGLPIAFSPKSYAITAGLAALFLATGALVWLGIPVGKPLTRVCSLFYLIRPRLCFQLWDLMRAPEFQAHFMRRPPVA
jgi:hypothetical protein